MRAHVRCVFTFRDQQSALIPVARFNFNVKVAVPEWPNLSEAYTALSQTNATGTISVCGKNREAWDWSAKEKQAKVCTGKKGCFKDEKMQKV